MLPKEVCQGIKCDNQWTFLLYLLRDVDTTWLWVCLSQRCFKTNNCQFSSCLITVFSSPTNWLSLWLCMCLAAASVSSFICWCCVYCSKSVPTGVMFSLLFECIKLVTVNGECTWKVDLCQQMRSDRNTTNQYYVTRRGNAVWPGNYITTKLSDLNFSKPMS